MAAATMTAIPAPVPAAKREGDISDSFASLSGADLPPLPEKFLRLKKSLVGGHEDQVISSWKQLLREIHSENDLIAKAGPNIIPSIHVDDLDKDITNFRAQLKKRGVAVIRNVIPEEQARAFKDDIENYVRENPQTKGFPHDNRQVFELYWSAPQIKARAHPNLLKAQRALMKTWHLSDPTSAISISQPLAYADRLRIRQPGDTNFALGPHMDGGSVERWEKDGYGLGRVYDKVFEGEWKEGYDPWDASTRVPAVIDNYNGLGACNMFRMLQGWLSMSETKPGEGTLKVYPLIQHSAVYLLLRPFFNPIKGIDEVTSTEEFLSEDNWEFAAGDKMTSELHGAVMGHGQELSPTLHPHLELERAMVHVPDIKPGDFVAWHCDAIHAVDQVHKGQGDSSVLYIPVCPVTEFNAKYLLRQKQAFLKGTPGPDFPGGVGESQHKGRPDEDFLNAHSDEEGRRAFGFGKLIVKPDDEASVGSVEVIAKANAIMGF